MLTEEPTWYENNTLKLSLVFDLTYYYHVNNQVSLKSVPFSVHSSGSEGMNNRSLGATLNTQSRGYIESRHILICLSTFEEF